MKSEIIHSDCFEVLSKMPNESVQCCVTSPPYWGLRDYSTDGQLGLEKTPEEYVARLVEIFREVRRVLRADGTLWLNLGDCYNSSASNDQGKGRHNSGIALREGARSLGRHERKVKNLKPKDLVGIPWRVAFALQADGWWLRSDIIWAKPNPMPESVRDRLTKSHEHIFLMTKSARYYYDHEAIKEPAQDWGDRDRTNWSARINAEEYGQKPNTGGEKGNFSESGRNKRDVWTVATAPYSEAHFATFPPKLIEPCILAGAPAGGVVLDPFAGSGTTGLVCARLGRQFIGIELNSEYCEIARKRIINDAPLFNKTVIVKR